MTTPVMLDTGPLGMFLLLNKNKGEKAPPLPPGCDFS